MRISREYETPFLLGMACVLLLVAVTAEWLWKTASQRSVRASLSSDSGSGAAPAEEAPPKAFGLPPLERFNDIVERPLFMQGRRPAAPEEQAPAEPEKPFDAKLHGIVSGPDGVLVLLKDKAGHHHKLREKEKLDGWVLTEVGKDRVVLTRGDAKQELLLQKPKPKEVANPAVAIEPSAEEQEQMNADSDKRQRAGRKR